MLSARALRYVVPGSRPPVTLIRDLDIDVHPGEIVAVLGPNGAGKSTMMRCLCRENIPTSGTVVLDGRSLADLEPWRRARHLGVLPQSSTLSFAFTAAEVVLLGRMPHIAGRETRRDVHVARLALQAAGVLHLEQRAYPTLSGGEKQRVHLARVMAQVWDAPEDGHRYLLLDEPLAGLDPRYQHGILERLRKLAGEGFGVLVSLHDLNLAARYASRVVLMRSGAVMAAGSPPEVLTEELLRRTFDVDVLVTEHPRLDVPLIATAGAADEPKTNLMLETRS